MDAFLIIIQPKYLKTWRVKAQIYLHILAQTNAQGELRENMPDYMGFEN